MKKIAEPKNEFKSEHMFASQTTIPSHKEIQVKQVAQKITHQQSEAKSSQKILEESIDLFQSQKAKQVESVKKSEKHLEQKKEIKHHHRSEHKSEHRSEHKHDIRTQDYTSVRTYYSWIPAFYQIIFVPYYIVEPQPQVEYVEYYFERTMPITEIYEQKIYTSGNVIYKMPCITRIY